MKPRKSFYNLSFPQAMKVAKDVACLNGPMDWALYREWMAKYVEVQDRRRAREMVFAEQLKAAQ